MTFSNKSYNSIGVLLRRSNLRMLFTILYIIAVAILPPANAEKRQQRKIIAEFEHSGQLNLSHVVVDDDENRFFSGRQHRWRSAAGNGDIYLAGGNVLYQLDRQLRLKHRIKTGPVEDSHLCGPSGCGSDREQDLMTTQNFNKLLVIDKKHKSLLACGSVKQGVCTRYKLTDITDQAEEMSQPVAANTRTASTFAFIGPSRYNLYSDVNDVLYVGTTFTDHGEYRHDVPAVSARSLGDKENLFFAEYGFSSQSLLNIDVKYKDHFLVDYIYGFNSSQYVYFLTVQKKSYLPGDSESGYISRISRTCISDSNFNTYSEVTLECRINGDNYNLLQSATLGIQNRYGVPEPILMAAFAPAQHGASSRALPRTAFCTYSLDYIDRLFDENLHMCFNGTMQQRNLPYISGPVDEGKCPRAGTTGNIVDFCQRALKISGQTPILQEIGIKLPPTPAGDTLVTSVSSANTHSNLLAILGTSNGQIFKVLVTPNSAEIIDTFQAAQDEAILNSVLSPGSEELLVLTPRRLRYLRIADCVEPQFCGQCLGRRDPFCGWCSLENECTLSSECRGVQRNNVNKNNKNSNNAWLYLGGAGQCVQLETILPEAIGVTEMTNISLQISSLPDPPPGEEYLCVYNGAVALSAIYPPSGLGGLTCPPPPLTARPPIPAGKDHVAMRLAVTLSSASKEFVSTELTIFDCRTQSTCLECVASQWACMWCIYSNRCTHASSSSDTCKEAIVSSDTSLFQLLQDNPSQLISRGSDYCPRVQVSKDLFIPNGIPQELSLTVSNIPDLSSSGSGSGKNDFLCEVEIEDAKFRVPARLSGDTVTCERTSSYKYEANLPMLNATISVLWDANHLVDRTNISLYKCGLVGSYRGHQDCSLCISRTQDLGCVWCGTGCDFTTGCPVGQSDICPQPRIDLVQPLSGPVDGGTEIIIEGSNLATNLQEVEGRIFLGNIPCTVIDYQVSVRISCRTGRSGRETDLSIRLRGDNGIIESAIKFRYREIIVTNVTPRIGPRSGGTLITLEGVNLNIGSSISILLDNIPCQVDRTRMTSSRVSCRTGASPGPMAVRSLVLIIDDARRTLSNPYNYTADPTIEAVKPLWSFLSGGRILTVRGRNLHTVETPYITALDKRGVGVGRSACTVVTSTLMECPSPPIHVSAAQLMPEPDQEISLQQAKERSQEQPFRIGFEMDSVESGLLSPGDGSRLPGSGSAGRMSSSGGGTAELIYVEDPVYYKFQGNQKSYKGDALVIEGYNLNRAADENDLNVRIGTGSCNVTSLTPTQLLCLPPQTPPSPIQQSQPEVVVYVGRNLKFEIGLLRYDVDSADLFLPPQVIGGIAAATALALFVMIAFLVAMRHKRTQAEREYKRIQIQMDTLENNVRSECKQAFAELQTDMSDLTMDLEVAGIPLLDHRTYVMKVFFPGQGDHRLFLDPRLSGMTRTARSDLDTAMLQFEQLINNKMFLLTFVDVLERQKSFSVEDRMNTASLIMIILMTKMEYCTDILRCLLLRQIEKSLSTKSPGSMLSRTETILEKLLSNWLTLCLYDYMKDYAGSSLFVLFKAIKFQIEKGPVDAVTNDARYSLSEDKLLREQVVVCTVSCTVVQQELEEEVVVRVLDCDTISQVKAKILDAVYKNTPFSLRPRVDEVDLEWRCGQYAQPGTPAGTLVLQDVDITSKSIGGVVRLNTLCHYGLKEKAIVSLVPKQLDSPSQHIYQAVSVSGQHTLLGGGGGGPPHHNSAGDYARVAGGGGGAIYQQYNVPIYSGTGTLYTHAKNTNTSPPPYGTMYSGGLGGIGLDINQQFFHFVSPDDNSQSVLRSHKQIPEIFLTRLLSTKGTVQKFVDDFFGTILKVPGSKFPAPVKWLFDLLDDVATQHNLLNTEVLHSWKSNSLPLRIWVNFIKNPDFIFDVNKTQTVNSGLSVIAQTFMDSCSLDENILGKDSPSSKLLFAKDIPLYRQLVIDYYKEVQRLPQVTDQELSFHLQQLSSAHSQQFDNLAALKELYVYVSKYYGEIMLALNQNINCTNQRLAQRLENVAMTLYSSQQQQQYNNSTMHH